MKVNLLKNVALAATLVFAVSCKDAENEVKASEAEQAAEATAEAVTYNVDTEASKIQWLGSKVAGSHNGTIDLEGGMVKVSGENVESGEFMIDMSSITVTDLEGEDAASLKGHLQSGDFFNVQEYPTAKFVVTSINTENGQAMLSGNLTMKDVTKNVSFPVNVKYDGNKMMLNSETFTIDRTEWGIKYGSSSLADTVKDKAISDDIELTVNLVATK
jgi:polyisoprenoid-binding protein YceI